MSQQPPEWAQEAAWAGSREAIGWALRFLEPGAPSAAGDLLAELKEMELAKAEVLLSQLVNLTAEFAVRAGDMEKLRMLLRTMRRG